MTIPELMQWITQSEEWGMPRTHVTTPWGLVDLVAKRPPTTGWWAFIGLSGAWPRETGRVSRFLTGFQGVTLVVDHRPIPVEVQLADWYGVGLLWATRSPTWIVPTPPSPLYHPSRAVRVAPRTAFEGGRYGTR